MTSQKPSVGRIVHYVSRGSADGVYLKECRAAVVAAVGAWIPVGDPQAAESYSASEGRPIRSITEWFFDDACALVVLNPTGQFFNETCPYDGGRAPAGGTWHWPEMT